MPHITYTTHPLLCAFSTCLVAIFFWLFFFQGRHLTTDHPILIVPILFREEFWAGRSTDAAASHRGGLHGGKWETLPPCLHPRCRYKKPPLPSKKRRPPREGEPWSGHGREGSVDQQHPSEIVS